MNKLRKILSSPLSAADAVGLLCVWTLIAVFCFLRVFAGAYMPAAGGVDIHGYLPGRDFVNVWTAGRLVMSGDVSALYDVTAYQSAMDVLLGREYPEHNFAYPPHILPLLPVFGLAAYMPSLVLWTLAGMAALVLVLRVQKSARMNMGVLVMAVLSPAALANIISGQNGFFTAALFLGGLYLCEASPILAGVLFGLLTVKPHMGVLILPLLLFRRQWRCAVAAVATSLSLVALSLLCFGTTPWVEYVTQALPFQSKLLQPGPSFYFTMMPGPYADALTALGWPVIAAAGYAVLAAIFAAVVAWREVSRHGITPRGVLVLALATAIILPYSFNYDMVAVAGAMVVYLATTPTVTGRHLLLGLLWALPLAVPELKNFPYVPCSSVIMLAALALLWREGAAIASAHAAARQTA